MPNLLLRVEKLPQKPFFTPCRASSFSVSTQKPSQGKLAEFDASNPGKSTRAVPERAINVDVSLRSVPITPYQLFLWTVRVRRHSLPELSSRIGGVFEMRQNVGILKYQQYLSQSAAEILKQMTELKQLREAVHLAEVAKGRNSQRS
jgi:hypothetical protein